MLQVNDNGLISFEQEVLDSNLPTFPSSAGPLVAPFYSDVNVVNDGDVFYR